MHTFLSASFGGREFNKFLSSGSRYKSGIEPSSFKVPPSRYDTIIESPTDSKSKRLHFSLPIGYLFFLVDTPLQPVRVGHAHLGFSRENLHFFALFCV